MSRTSLTVSVREFMGDLDTPVTLYLKLGESPSFLLESVAGGEQIARYSFIGCRPFMEFRAENGQIDVTFKGQKRKETGEAIAALREVVNQFELNSDKDLPPFIGGAVGYFSWEIMSEIEKIDFAEKAGVEFPDAQFMFPGVVLAFDHVQRKILVLAIHEQGESMEAVLDEIEAKIKTPLSADLMREPHLSGVEDPFECAVSNYDENAFKADVEKAKGHIFDGDIFQIVLSQRFNLESRKSPFNIYRSLRYLNPSPYMFYMNFGSYQLVGSSPEILVRCQDRKAAVRPLAGTRPRLKGQEEAMIKELLADEKERAEHIMLVDLGRNDLGRVCEPGSVKTTDLMGIEKYSHVMHIVSHVEGVLREDKDVFDLFKATFPAGTVSGAPKIRAMEILESLEPDRRGPYSGALGYFDFRGNADLCIMIRTIVSRGGGRYFVQAGAGIVADSDPDAEFKETQNKAKGMILACLGD